MLPTMQPTKNGTLMVLPSACVVFGVAEAKGAERDMADDDGGGKDGSDIVGSDRVGKESDGSDMEGNEKDRAVGSEGDGELAADDDGGRVDI